MINTLLPSASLAQPQPNYWEMQQRLQGLIDRYLPLDHLTDRLTDLPQQFIDPQPRPWAAIDWPAIHSDQVIGIDLPIFLAILKGTLDTEAPIRGYTQTSRQYLEHLHSPMARFVGGTLGPDGTLQTIGLWEKEERQHTPALLKVYSHLTGTKITPYYRTVRGYCPTSDPYQDLYRHGLHRVATEYSATCLYLWLMAHTTGPLHAVFEQLAIDEINHMTKYWGFGVWAYPDTSLMKVGRTIIQMLQHRNRSGNSLLRTLRRMMGTLNWSDWSLTQKATLMFTFAATLRRLWVWHNSLTPAFLQDLFGSSLSLDRPELTQPSGDR
jgi:hypothetical protein